MRVEVKNLSCEVLAKLDELGLIVPNRCFGNCAMIVFGVPNARFRYALCWLFDRFEQKHPHAILERDGDFFDPTLQGEHQFRKNYELVKVFSREEMLQTIVAEGGSFNAKENALSGHPPALLMDGTISCVDVMRPRVQT